MFIDRIVSLEHLLIPSEILSNPLHATLLEL